MGRCQVIEPVRVFFQGGQPDMYPGPHGRADVGGAGVQVSFAGIPGKGQTAAQKVKGPGQPVKYQRQGPVLFQTDDAQLILFIDPHKKTSVVAGVYPPGFGKSARDAGGFLEPVPG